MEEMSQTEEQNSLNEQSAKRQEEVFSFGANIQSNLPIILAVVGMLFGILTLASKGCNTDGHFHDLVLSNKKDILPGILKARAMAIRHKINDLAIYGQMKRPEKATDPVALRQDSLAKLETELQATSSQIDAAPYLNLDSNLSYYKGYLSVNRSEMAKALEQKKPELDVLTIDTARSMGRPAPAYAHAKLRIARDDKMTLLEYIRKYPAAGFWLTISMAQSACWFMAACLVIAVAMSASKKADSNGQLKAGYFIVPTLLPLAVVGIFVFVLYKKLIATYIVSDYFFLDGFTNRIIFYSVPGYLSAVICFGTYLFLANRLELLNAEAKKNQKSVTTDLALADKYDSLKRAFDFSFLCTTVIFSVYMLWLGVLFSMVNNIEAIRFYGMMAGRPLLEYDFVYLIGILHSLLLMAFYIPVNLRFQSLQVTRDKATVDDGSGSPAKVIRTFWNVLGTILVTASPLITTVLQKIISGFFGG